MQSARSTAKTLLAWFAGNARDLPWRRTRDPYAIWISEIMLQQTQVKTVIPYWERWMRELPDVRALAAANESRVLKLWEGLGYYSRARNLHRAAQKVVAENAGEFPRAFDAILSLPGIGRYTAGAICSIAFNEPMPVLDGNVLRVLTRLYEITANAKAPATTEKLWRIARELVRTAKAADAQNRCSHLNQALMELGALVCLPQNPKCVECPLRAKCKGRNRVHRIPNLPARSKTTVRRFVAFVARNRNRFLVRRRPTGVVNQGLWEFPNVEVTNGEADDLKKLARQTLGVAVTSPETLCSIRHSITRYRIQLDAFHCSASGRKNEGSWLTLEEINAQALTSAHRKIFERILKSEN